MDELDNSQAAPEGEPQASPKTELDELAGLLGEAEQPDESESDEPDEEPQEQGDKEDEPEPEPPKGVTDEAEVDLDGRKVSVRELKETFATFTRKTQELAEDKRNTLAQARQAVAEHAEQQAQTLHLMAQRMDQLAAPGFDDQALQQLAFSNPEQYYQVKARLDVAAQMRAGIQQEIQQQLRTAQQQRDFAQQEQQQAHAELLQNEGAKLASEKWFNDDFRNKAVAFARKHGIPEQAARSVAYAGFVQITRKAMLYDEAVARGKAGKQPPKVAATVPGSTPGKGALNRVKDVKGSYERARQSGDRHDIGAYLSKVLN